MYSRKANFYSKLHCWLKAYCLNRSGSLNNAGMCRQCADYLHCCICEQERSTFKSKCWYKWTAALRVAGFGIHVHTSFLTCENFRPRSLKVRSPGLVKLPHLRKSLNAHHSYTECPITLKLSVIDICTSIYKMLISEFLYHWPKVRSILRPLHYKSRGEEWKAPLLEENHSKHSQTSCYRSIWHPELEYCDQWPLSMLPRPFQVMKGHQLFLGNNFW